jgi:hypothetical protein
MLSTKGCLKMRSQLGSFVVICRLVKFYTWENPVSTRIYVIKNRFHLFCINRFWEIASQNEELAVNFGGFQSYNRPVEAFQMCCEIEITGIDFAYFLSGME